MNYKILYLLMFLVLLVLGCLFWVSSEGVVHAEVFNIDKLATAVAVAETSNCTKGVGRSKNNCFGINGKRGYVVFKSPAESYAVFKELWIRAYGLRFPTMKDAIRYTAGHNTMTWLSNVTRVYNR